MQTIKSDLNPEVSALVEKLCFSSHVRSAQNLISEQDTLGKMNQSLRNMVLQPNYPCVAAIQAVQKNEYYLGDYGEIGRGFYSRLLAQDLLLYLAEQRQTRSRYLTFWAGFSEGPQNLTEDEFEAQMWSEISILTSHKDLQFSWDSNFSSNPQDPNFTFSLGGFGFFLVGLHQQSSRLSRQSPFPSIVFNIYDQFEDLHRHGLYHPMVKTNRDRDRKFQGQVNPMVEKYGDQWEAIQFSGKSNESSWKCPFQHGQKPTERKK